MYVPQLAPIKRGWPLVNPWSNLGHLWSNMVNKTQGQGACARCWMVQGSTSCLPSSLTWVPTRHVGTTWHTSRRTGGGCNLIISTCTLLLVMVVGSCCSASCHWGLGAVVWCSLRTLVVLVAMACSCDCGGCCCGLVGVDASVDALASFFCATVVFQSRDCM